MEDGDIVFGKRALDGTPMKAPFLTGSDIHNREGLHEHIFYKQDGKLLNIGFMGSDKGIVFNSPKELANISAYSFSEVYHVNNIQEINFYPSGFAASDYALATHNCQDYADNIAAQVRWQQGYGSPR